MADRSGKKKRAALWVAIGIAAVVAICCGGAHLYLSAQVSKTYGVPLVVNAEGLDTRKGTKITIHATGKDSSGNSVDSVFHAGSDSSDIALRPGDYCLAIEASPIAADGTIYDTKGASTKVSINKDGKANVKKEITIKPVPAEEVTDAQIDAAYKAAKDSGISSSKLDKLKEKAQKRRDDAVAAKKAEEEKKTDEANKSTEASTSESEQTSTDQASSGGHSFTTDYFYVDVPSDWKQNEWSVTQLDDHTWQISHKPANDYGGAICIAVAKDNPWPVYGTQELGATGTGLNVYVGNGAGDGLEKYLTIGLTKSWDPNDPNSVRGDGMTNSQFQDQLNAREWLKAQQESQQQQ